MTEREIVEALTILVGSRRKARGLLARTTVRHLAIAQVEELERLMPPMIARRFHAALDLAKHALAPERPVSLKVQSAAYAPCTRSLPAARPNDSSPWPATSATK